MTKTLPILAIASSLFAFAACGGDKPAPAQQSAQPATQPAAQQPAATQPKAQQPAVPAIKKPKLPPKLDMTLIAAYFGNEPSAPKAESPSTPEKVALGKALYHDTSLSKNGNLSCASCHDLNNYGQDGKATSPGSDGKNGDRNSPTTLNAARNLAQFWDGRAESVEDQAIMPVLNPIEHGVADEKELLAKINAKADLVAAFQKAFPGDGSVSVDNFKHAIGAFERTLVTKSPFDDSDHGPGLCVRLGPRHSFAGGLVPGASRRIRLCVADPGQPAPAGSSRAAQPGAGVHGDFHAGSTPGHHGQQCHRQSAGRQRLVDAVGADDANCLQVHQQ